MNVDNAFADAALDLATPVEPATAAFQHGGSDRVVTAATAQQLAAVRCQITGPPRRPPLAPPAVRSQRSRLGVRLAVVGRRVDVQQVVLGGACAAARSASTSAGGRCRGWRGSVGADQPRSRPVERRLHGAVVLVTKMVSDFAKRWQLVPTRSHIAGAGHAVTLARRLRVLVHRLRTRTQALHCKPTYYEF